MRSPALAIVALLPAALAGGCSDYDLLSDDDSVPIPDDDTTPPPDDDTVVADPEEPAIALSPDYLQFDYLAPGHSASLGAEVVSAGSDPLTVTAVEWEAGSSAEMHLDLDFVLPLVLAPGDRGALAIHYAPADTEPDAGVLAFHSDDAIHPIALLYVAVSECAITGWDGDFFVQPAPGGLAMEVYASRGDGTFDPPMVVGDDLGESYGGIVVADLDGDTHLEISAGTPSGRRFVLDYGCGGAWEQREVDPVAFSVVGGGDLDGDGDVDLFGWDASRVGHTAYGLGDGGFVTASGTFDPAAAYTGYNQGGAYRAGDVDGDGIPDIVTYEYSSGGTASTGIHVHRGNGDGTFAAPVRVGQLSQPANGADLGDVDGDGVLDLWIGLDDDGDPGQSWVLLGTGPALAAAQPSFDVDPTVESGADQCCTGGARLHDWDGDGWPDALAGWATGSWVDPQVDLFRGDGTVAFGAPELVLAVGEAMTTHLATPIR